MRIERRTLLLLALLLIVLGAGITLAGRSENAAPAAPVTDSPTEGASVPGNEAPTAAPAPLPRTAIVRAPVPVAPDTALRKGAATVATPQEATATLTVDGVRYGLTAPEGATLKEALDRLQAETSFTYQYRSYTGLGAFVTHINGRASGNDRYWILYVNGKKSAAGISSTRIQKGDVIEWNLEESY
ncbi:MAG TPA: DUF4430 domain-containing protein [Candidatus Paceibacterota bacterium]|jgi:hypothetical protein